MEAKTKTWRLDLVGRVIKLVSAEVIVRVPADAQEAEPEPHLAALTLLPAADWTDADLDCEHAEDVEPIELIVRDEGEDDGEQVAATFVRAEDGSLRMLGQQER
jgi:hypothetical protein